MIIILFKSKPLSSSSILMVNFFFFFLQIFFFFLPSGDHQKEMINLGIFKICSNLLSKNDVQIHSRVLGLIQFFDSKKISWNFLFLIFSVTFHHEIIESKLMADVMNLLKPETPKPSVTKCLGILQNIEGF